MIEENKTVRAFFDILRKTQAEKKLKQIIQKLNNLPTKNWLFAFKSPEVDIFCTKKCPKPKKPELKCPKTISVITVTRFFRYLVNKNLRRRPFFRCSSEIRYRTSGSSQINSGILVNRFFRYLSNKKLRRMHFFRYFSEFRYLGFRYSSRYL